MPTKAMTTTATQKQSPRLRVKSQRARAHHEHRGDKKRFATPDFVRYHPEQGRRDNREKHGRRADEARKRWVEPLHLKNGRDERENSEKTDIENREPHKEQDNIPGEHLAVSRLLGKGSIAFRHCGILPLRFLRNANGN